MKKIKEITNAGLGCLAVVLIGVASMALLAITAFAVTYGVCFAIDLVF